MKVAVIGLGNMGGGIANRILQAGHELTVWNRSEAKMAPLIAAGAKGAASARAAAEGAQVVVTSLMDDKSVLEGVQGPQGFLSGMKPGAIHLCVTTISPACADQLGSIHAAHGTRFVSAPVAGRPDAAAAGNLTTFLAGERSAVEEVSPLCMAFSRKTVRIGERPGLANSMKLCVNYTAISIIELMGEVYAFAESKGIDPDAVFEFYMDAFAHPALKTYVKKLKENQVFSSEGGFAMTTGLKDVRLMLADSADAGVSFEIAKIVERKMVKAIDSGMAQADWSAIAAITRSESGLG